MLELTIIIPTLGSKLHLNRCLTALEISLKEVLSYEIILVAPAGVLNWLDPSDHVKIIDEVKNNGVYGAMNEGVLASRGEYLYFMGDDDIFLGNFEVILMYLRGRKSDILLFDAFFGCKKTAYNNYKLKWALLYKNWCHQGVIYRRTCFDRVGLFKVEYKTQADHRFNLDLVWGDSKLLIDRIKKPLVWYSFQGLSTQVKDKSYYHDYPEWIEANVGIVLSWFLKIWRSVRL